MCEPAYLAWCEQHHIVVSGVVPAFVADGWRGVVATARLSKGDVIMSVPAQLLMSVVSARQHDPSLAAQLQQYSQLSSHQVLTLHLLHEASEGSRSVWAPYIQQLPRHYTTLIAWPPAALQALQLQHARDAATAAVDKARAEWQAARPVLKALGVEKKWISWRAWVWAASTVLSRTMYHPADPCGCGCLTPLADLHNYAPPPPPYTPNLARDMQQLLAQQSAVQHQQQQQPSQELQQQQQPGRELQQDQQPSQEQEQQPEDCTGAALSCGVSGPDDNAAHQGQAGTGDSSCCGAAISAEPPQKPLLGCQATDADSAALPSTACAAGGAGDGSAGFQQTLPASTAATAAASAVAAETSETAVVVDEPGEAGQALEGTSSISISGDGFFDATEGVYKIVVRRSYAPGEQVFLCYGRHTNLELLELYGFLTANPHETAVLPLQPLQTQLQRAFDAQLRQRQQQQLGRQPTHARGKSEWRALRVDGVADADCWLHVNGQPSWQLLSALRLAAATPADVRSSGFKALNGEPISLDSEVLVLTALAGACRAQLAELPTTEAQDAQLLRQLQDAAARGEGRADSCTETRAGASDESEHLSCMQLDNCSDATQNGQHAATALPLNKQQQHSDDDRQQERFARECLSLAVAWRLSYKSCLTACIQHCEEALRAARLT